MTLKEAYRYQTFINMIIRCAEVSITNPEHCLVTTKVHYRNQVNPEVEDTTEVVNNGDFYKNDDIIAVMLQMVTEREKLTAAINKAKRIIFDNSNVDIDAATESNKYRRRVIDALRTMLSYITSTRKENGYDYKFNAEGNQTEYKYVIETLTSDNYDRAAAKELIHNLMIQADEESTMIDSCLVTDSVAYNPLYNVNYSFNDVMDAYLAKH